MNLPNLVSYQGETIRYDREPGKAWTATKFWTGEPVPMTAELKAEIERVEAKRK